MSEGTAIQWTTNTFNPWWGCTKVGPGCDHCYAEAFDKRTGGSHWGSGAPRKRTSEANWRLPRKWDLAARGSAEPVWVFCASMADVFDNEVDSNWRVDLWDLIRSTPHLRYQILTKRIGNALKMLPSDFPRGFGHVGFMATVVTQAEAHRDCPKLYEVKQAGARWTGLSCEPLIEGLELARHLSEIDWVICGGESGPRSRPFNLQWARDLRDQCADAGTAFFMKQIGSGAGLSDKKGGDWSEWPADLCIREMPRVFALPLKGEEQE